MILPIKGTVYFNAEQILITTCKWFAAARTWNFVVEKKISWCPFSKYFILDRRDDDTWNKHLHIHVQYTHTWKRTNKARLIPATQNRKFCSFNSLKLENFRWKSRKIEITRKIYSIEWMAQCAGASYHNAIGHIFTVLIFMHFAQSKSYNAY